MKRGFARHLWALIPMTNDDKLKTNEARLSYDAGDDALPPALASDDADDDLDFPFPVDDAAKILGVRIDNHLTLDVHFRYLLCRLQVRQAVLSRVAKQKWGLDTAIIKITHDALITSFVRFGLIMVGSCLPDDLDNRMDTQIIDHAAKSIVRLPFPTRIEPPHFLAGTQSSRNLYFVDCADFVHAALVAERVNCK